MTKNIISLPAQVPAEEQLAAPRTSEASFRNRILQLEAEIEERDERIAIMAESEDAQAVEKRFDQQVAVIKVLRSQMNAWMRKHEAELYRGNGQEKIIKKQAAQIEALENRVLALSH